MLHKQSGLMRTRAAGFVLVAEHRARGLAPAGTAELSTRWVEERTDRAAIRSCRDPCAAECSDGVDIKLT